MNLSQIDDVDESNNITKEISQLLFTDLNGILKARLSAVIPNRSANNFGKQGIKHRPVLCLGSKTKRI
jgi:hypothetical protein